MFSDLFVIIVMYSSLLVTASYYDYNYSNVAVAPGSLVQGRESLGPCQELHGTLLYSCP